MKLANVYKLSAPTTHRKPGSLSTLLGDRERAVYILCKSVGLSHRRNQIHFDALAKQIYSEFGSASQFR